MFPAYDPSSTAKLEPLQIGTLEVGGLNPSKGNRKG